MAAGHPVTHTNLLDLPFEIRCIIYRHIYHDICRDLGELWHKQIVTSYDGLQQACQQLHHESQQFWRHGIVSKAHFSDFIRQPICKEPKVDIASLTLQVPSGMSDELFSQGASLFRALAHSLRHLRIFFDGSDVYGVRTKRHNCDSTILLPEATSAELMINQADFDRRLSLARAVRHLSHLQTLVLQNLNLPLVNAAVVKGSMSLEKLYIVNQPRNSIHVPQGPLSSPLGSHPVSNHFPVSVKEIQISTDAVSQPSKVVRRYRRSVEHLTWIMPDTSRQDIDADNVLDWKIETVTMLNDLGSCARKLHTLRLCLENGIDSDRTFLRLAPSLTSLKRLEIHSAHSSAQRNHDFLTFLPPSIEQLYLTDDFIPVDLLVQALDCVYFRRRCTGNDINHSYDDQIDPRFDRSDEPTLIGDDLHRTDFICMQKVALQFVTYVYTPSVDPDEALAQRIALFKINGRLLDRTVNRHLASHKGGHIARRFYQKDVVLDRATGHPVIDEQVSKLVPPTTTDILDNHEELRALQYRDDIYFGLESAAEKVFERESIINRSKLPKRSYAIEVDVDHDEHWMCP